MARELRQMTSRCLLGTDQPVTELHDSLHFTEAAGISVDISPGTGDRRGIPRPQPSTPRALPGAGVSLGIPPPLHGKPCLWIKHFHVTGGPLLFSCGMGLLLLLQ